MKTVHHRFPEPRVTSWNCAFYVTNSPKPEDIQLNIIENYKKTANIHIQKAGTEKNDFSDSSVIQIVAYSFSD